MLASLFLVCRDPCPGTNDKASRWPKENQDDGPNVLAHHCAHWDFVQVGLKLRHLALEIAETSSGSLVFSNLPYLTLSVAFIQMLKVRRSMQGCEGFVANVIW
jgi:hypothetical protein